MLIEKISPLISFGNEEGLIKGKHKRVIPQETFKSAIHPRLEWKQAPLMSDKQVQGLKIGFRVQ